MEGSAAGVDDGALDAALALLATPDATGPIGRPSPDGAATGSLGELVGDERLGLASIDRGVDHVSLGAMAGVRSLLPELPPPLAAFVAEATDPAFLDTATVGDAVTQHHRVTSLMLALLACEAVVTLASRSVPYDLPLAALVVGTPPPSDSVALGLRLATTGDVGLALDSTAEPSIVAVARRNPAGQVLVAMSGVAPGPVLVRDPAEHRRGDIAEHDLERTAVVHRRAIEQLGTGVTWTAASVVAPESVGGGAAFEQPIRRALLERRPGETPLADDAEVVVDHHDETPRWRWIGQPRPIPPVHEVARPDDALRVAVVEVAGPDEIDPLRRIDDVVGATVVDGEAGALAVGLLATTEAAIRRAMAAAGAHRPRAAGEGTTVVETIPIVGSADEVAEADDTTLFETYLRIDAGRDGQADGAVFGALDDEGRIVVSGRLADPFALRRSIARSLGVPAGTLRMMARPGSGAPVPDSLVRLVARAVHDSGRPVLGTGSGAWREGRAFTASSTLDDDGALATMQVQSIGAARSSTPSSSGEAAVAWAAELHFAALARSLGDQRDELRDATLLGRSMADAVARVKQVADFDRRRDLRWSSPSDRPGVSRGIGLALAPGVPEGSAAASATVTWAGGASFVVAVTAGDTVTGLHLALAQIAAEVLGSSPDDISVIGGDTDRVPPGEGIVDAGFAVVAGAVKQASDDLRRRFARRAARRLGTEPERVELLDGAAVGPDGVAVSFDELGSRTTAIGMEPLVGSGWGTGTGRQAGGATAVVVEVELSTGMSTVLEIVTATCAGVVVNPLGASAHQRREMIDAVAEALGRSIDEQPVLTTLYVEEPDDAAPCGARSLGGVVRRSVLPALHAAIFDATGIELDVVPFSAARLRSALHAGR